MNKHDAELYERCINNAVAYWHSEVGTTGVTFSDWLRNDNMLTAWTWADYKLEFETEADRVAFVLRWS